VFVNMLKNIESLIKLQDVDKAIRHLELEKKDIPNILNQSQEKINTEKQNLEDVKKILTDKQLEKKSFDLELATIEENIKKHNIELNSVKSNDRYKAIIDIINNEKCNKSLLEDKILADFDDLDLFSENVNKEKEKLKQIEQEFEMKKIELEDKLKTIDVELENLSTNRLSILESIEDKNLIELYEKIRANQNGIGISALDTETSSCSSCHMSLPFQKINDVMASENAILCENCSKILYVAKK